MNIHRKTPLAAGFGEGLRQCRSNKERNSGGEQTHSSKRNAYPDIVCNGRRVGSGVFRACHFHKQNVRNEHACGCQTCFLRVVSTRGYKTAGEDKHSYFISGRCCVSRFADQAVARHGILGNKARRTKEGWLSQHPGRARPRKSRLWYHQLSTLGCPQALLNWDSLAQPKLRGFN